MACLDGRCLFRRITRISTDGAVAAGMGEHRARPLGRCADELAVVAGSVALTLAVYGICGGLFHAAYLARRRLRRIATARQCPCRAVGYADLPLAAYFTVAVLAFLCWNDTQHARRARLLLLIACSQINNPGVFWAITVIPGLFVAVFPRHGLKLAGVAFG
jgi:hypothetical protein